MTKKFKKVYAVLALAVILAVPQLVMDKEDGNLLVRLVMMAIIALLFSGIYYLLLLFIRYRNKRRRCGNN